MPPSSSSNPVGGGAKAGPRGEEVMGGGVGLRGGRAGGGRGEAVRVCRRQGEAVGWSVGRRFRA